MKKQKLKGLKLNKLNISSLSYEALGGKEGVETFDGLMSNFGPCQGGTKCCDDSYGLYCSLVMNVCPH
jgi:hypothetical protein